MMRRKKSMHFCLKKKKYVSRAHISKFSNELIEIIAYRRRHQGGAIVLDLVHGYRITSDKELSPFISNSYVLRVYRQHSYL